MKTTYNKVIKFVFLICLFSLFNFSCDNFLQPPKSGKSGDGYISLSIGGIKAGRTILPEVTIGNFKGYILEFKKEGAEPIIMKFTVIPESIPLSAGKYNLHITAYMDADCTLLAAQKNIEGIDILPGQKNVLPALVLEAIINKDKKGTFKWVITYPTDVATAIMTVSKINIEDKEASVLPEEINLKEYTGSNPKEYETGYYRVVINLKNTDGDTAEIKEILHIYQNMESVFDYTFLKFHFSQAIYVTKEEDDYNSGSLRWAIERAKLRNTSTIIIDNSRVKKIELKDSLAINKIESDEFENIIIEGNGVIITKELSFSDKVSLINISYSLTAGPIGTLNITIRRIHFTGGDAENGGAILKKNTNLILESCIFSGNQANNGGAIYNESGVINIKGCTFYGNYVKGVNGRISAIYDYAGNLNLTGNLFYGNAKEIIESNNSYFGDYNVVDVEEQKISAPNNKYVTKPTVIHKTFNPIFGKGAEDFIISLPSDYPTIDFYGNPITAAASAGAVQEKVYGNTVTITFNNEEEDNRFFPVAIISGGNFEQPVIPVKFGYDHIGWFDKDNNQINFPYTVNRDITLYAKWRGKDVKDVKEWLSVQTSGGFSSDPIFLPMQISLGNMESDNSEWKKLLEVLDDVKKYVSLDLSACTMNGTEFDPVADYVNGKQYIVDIILPDMAASIKNGNPTGPSTFYNFTSLENFKGKRLTSVSDYAFTSCNGFRSIDLPEGITSIGVNAFSSCTSLEYLYLPKNLDTIGSYAFNGCSSLSTVVCYAQTPPALGTSALENTSITKIWVPAESINYYKTAVGWSEYENKMEPITW